MAREPSWLLARISSRASNVSQAQPQYAADVSKRLVIAVLPAMLVEL